MPSAKEPSAPETARIVELRVNNFARIKVAALRLNPGGGLVEITGRNDQGKSALLQSIKALIDGPKESPPKAIRRGAERAELYGVLVDEKGAPLLKIWRVIRGGKHGGEVWDLKVTAADGALVKNSPQGVIDAFKARVGFDPLAFAALKPREKFDILKGMVPGFDFEANAHERKAAYDARTDANRDKEREAAAGETIPLPGGPILSRVDVTAKIDELQRAAAHNTEIESRRSAMGVARGSIERLRDEAEALRARAATLEQQADGMEISLDTAPPIPEPIDVAALRAEISEADRINAICDRYNERENHLRLAAGHEAESLKYTDTIAALDKAKADAIAAAKLPVEGLSLGDNVVLLDGVPLDEAGKAKKIRTCIAIAMALNAGLKAVLVDEGSELDGDNRALVHKMALERGYHVIVTRVDETGEVGFVVSDGEVVREPAA
jgi:hypothetical protein